MKNSILIFLLLGTCKTIELPKTQLNQYRLDVDYEFQENELRLTLKNPLHCPVRIWVKSEDPNLNSYLDSVNPIITNPLKDTLFTFISSDIKIKELDFAAKLGDPSKQIQIRRVELPFQRNKSYKLIQGPNSEPTHNTDYSRYALDFGLSIGDTICAATKGYVVGVIEDYKTGGTGKEWKNYGNFITIYDPQSGLYTQYVHLVYKGSFVNVGDEVVSGQVIGLSGMTGQTNGEHLHFNCLKPSHSEEGFISLAIDSIGKYKVSELNRYEWVKNEN